MFESKKWKQRRNTKSLFNPYKNGISFYDMAYLSSGKVIPNKKNNNLDNESKKENLAA